MIIDCHGHFTTAPKALHAWRKKQLVLVEGATHGFTPCRPAFGDTMARTFDYVDAWLKQAGRCSQSSSHH
jgi:hypothetical protein